MKFAKNISLVILSALCASTAFAVDPEIKRSAANPRTGVVCLHPSGLIDVHGTQKGCNTRIGEKKLTVESFAAAASGAVGAVGPVGPQGPAGVASFPTIETFIFGVADATTVTADDQTLRNKKLCFSAGTQQIDVVNGSAETTSNFVGVVVPAASGITAANFSAQTGHSMGVAPAVSAWAVNSSSMNSDGTRNWRVIYGCSLPPAQNQQVAINVSSPGRCAGRLVVTCVQ